MKQDKITSGAILLLGIVLLSSSVIAFSVSAPYLENKQLQLYPGAEADLKFDLQNSGTTVDTLAKVEIVEGADITRLADRKDTYTIPPGGTTSVNIKITIPNDMDLGQTRHIKLTFTSREEGAGGFNLGSSIGQEFDVLIGEKPLLQKSENSTGIKLSIWAYLILGLIILIVIIFYIKRKSKEKSANIQPNKKQAKF